MFDPGEIVYNDKTKEKGIVLTSDINFAEVLRYDFSTEVESIKDIRKIGSSDAIYKSMYELARCEVK